MEPDPMDVTGAAQSKRLLEEHQEPQKSPRRGDTVSAQSCCTP
jgi:hypothetical protein